jgi:hypothetical protein
MSGLTRCGEPDVLDAKKGVASFEKVPLLRGHARFAGPRIGPEEKGPDCSTAFLVCPPLC